MHKKKVIGLNSTGDEINSFMKNETWSLLKLPQGDKVIKSKWTYKVKYGESGKIKRYKARLVAQGFTQKYGIDFDETHVPVVSNTTLRCFHPASDCHNLSVRNFDIKTAFLDGELEEEVYMSQPKGV